MCQKMNRILSFEQVQRCSGQSEYVTKRLCISVVFSIGFLCVLGGYLLGKMAADARHWEQNQGPFSQVPKRVANLLSRAEFVAKYGLETNSTKLSTDIVNSFKCGGTESPVVIGQVNEYLRQVLSRKEEELVGCINNVEGYLKSVS